MLGRLDNNRPLLRRPGGRLGGGSSERSGARLGGSPILRTQQLNRLSGIGLVLLSLLALIVVLWGYTQPPLADEGTGAHIFQLSVVALVPVTCVFVTTADWRRPSRTAWPLVIAIAATVLAFAALYYLEHVYYPEQLR
jgi:cytochrome bd-type quinol oxidase subunit 2